MKYLHLKLIGFLLAAVPGVSIAVDNWTGFVPPSSTQFKNENNYQKNKWHKTTWRSGANFKSHDDLNFKPTSLNRVNAKEYALTQPQRKSVNPWHVNRSWSARKQYKFGATIRPWGSVPQQFQKRSSGVVHSQAGMNRNFIPPPPAPMYQPYVNNNGLNNSNLLLPVNNYMNHYSPFFSGPRYMNNVNLFSPPYAFSNAHLWR